MTTLAADVGRAIARPRVSRMLVPLLVCMLCAAMLAGAGFGAVPVSPGRVVAIVLHGLGLETGVPFDARQEYVVLAIRLPRLLLGVCIGMVLGMSGASLQGIFRNPLADAGLIGTSSGAALGAGLAIVLGGGWLRGSLGTFGEFTVPAAAFAGGLGASLLVERIARARAWAGTAGLLLAGIAVNALAGAATGLLTYLASDAQLRSITFWSMGSLGAANWPALATSAPFFAVGLFVLPRLAGRLDALLLGEAESGHLGVDAVRLRRLVVVVAALAVGAAVSVAGIIGFVGLVAPNIVRSISGPSHRVLIPASGLLGAILLVAGDLVARTIVSPAELPIGIITAFIGAPVLVWLVARRAGGGDA